MGLGWGGAGIALPPPMLTPPPQGWLGAALGPGWGQRDRARRTTYESLLLVHACNMCDNAAISLRCRVA